MSAVRLASVTLHNFRSFRGSHTVRFPDSGLVILRGPSGHGKSSILLGVAYALGICRYSAKALQCWHDEDPMWVELELRTDAGTVLVRRGTKGLVIGKYRGKAAEEELDRVCGVPYTLREALTYRDQLHPKSLLAMSDVELKEFLTEVLDLGALEVEVGESEARAEVAATEASRQAEAVAAHHAAVEQRNAEMFSFEPQLRQTDLETLESRKAERAVLAAKVADTRGQCQRAAVEEAVEAERYAKTWVERAQALAAEVENPPAPLLVDTTTLDELGAKLAKCVEFLTDVREKDAVEAAAYEVETGRVRREVARLRDSAALLPGLKRELQLLTEQRRVLLSDSCPTCLREWDRAAAELAAVDGRLAEVAQKIDGVESDTSRLAEATAALAARARIPDARLAKLEKIRGDLRAQFAAEEARVDGEKRAARGAEEARVRQLKTAHAGALAEARAARQTYLSAPERDSVKLAAELREIEGDLRKVEDVVRSAEQSVAVARAHDDAARARAAASKLALKEAEGRLAEAERRHRLTEQDWKVSSDYAACLKGFRNHIFSEVLDQVGLDASEILGALPNTEHMTIEFRSERELKKGGSKERITPVVRLHGEERPIDEALSGGQLTSAALAVDLAGAQVVCERLGVRLNWLIFDEQFEGHNVETKEACLEVLRLRAADKLVVVVDHASEFKAMFSEVVEVRMEGSSSSVVVG